MMSNLPLALLPAHSYSTRKRNELQAQGLHNAMEIVCAMLTASARGFWEITPADFTFFLLIPFR